MAEDKSFLESEVRQKIIEALRKDLVGPLEENEVLDESPMFEYLTGMLYPQVLADCLEMELDADVDRSEQDSDYTPQPDEDDNEPMTATKFKQQSTIGMSFYLRKDTQKIKAVISWGDYIRTTEKQTNEKGEEKTKVSYTRQPMSETIEVDFTSFGKHQDYPLPVDSNLHLYVTKIGLKNDYMLVTMHLTNKRPKGNSALDSIIFQAQIEAFSEEREDCFVAENICRDILAPDEFYYAQRPIFGRGRGCAMMWESVNEKYASKVYTSFIPEYEFPGVRATIDGFADDHFSMSFMARPKHKEETIARLRALSDAYANWIEKTLVNDRRMSEEEFKAKIGDDVIIKCNLALKRIVEGINLIESDNTAFEAFCFMNSVMSLQRSISSYSKKYGKGIECNFSEFVDPMKKENLFCWRPFQIAFVLMNLNGIVNPTHADREIVDLLYFPTGGGKTEAYLGLIAFTIANRRLRNGEDSEFNSDGGVTAILRYTLRLLTTQQRDRLTKMVIAAEMERQRQYPRYGKEPISIGFWVGGGVTPNKFDDLKDNPDYPDAARNNKNLLYKQLLTCPFCGKELIKDNYHIDYDKKSVEIYCEDENCIFYKYKMPSRMSIPVYLVDEEIYNKCPTVILATVDKFANLPWNPSSNALFGRVDRKCERDGYIAMGVKHEARHIAVGNLPAAKVIDIKPFAPPELIVQDELHLITGPLGTIYGAYETIIQDLCSYEKDGRKILPKYVVSTATIKNAHEQIRCLYGRKKSMQFPANGFEIGDSFFIKEISIEDKPFRKYVGISASGQSMKTTTLRAYAIVLQTVSELMKEEKYKNVIDPYYTLVGYFNSIRELGGTVRLLQDDIPKRINRLRKKYNFKTIRYLNNRREITSRIPSSRITERLGELEVSSDKKGALDTAIATNMIAVGMDVDRLGLMTVMGQPKQNSEYIQATSRIGRQHPGLVFTLYNPYRPRDLSHYENFVGYHSQLYRYVEGTTATPFSARARDRVLHSLIIAAMRLEMPEYADNTKAKDIGNLSLGEKSHIINVILDRLAIVNPQARDDTKEEIERFIGDWQCMAAQSKPLVYYVGNKHLEKYNRLMNYYSEDCSRMEKGTLNSMREVEASATLFYWEE